MLPWCRLQRRVVSTVLRAYRALAFCCLLAWSFASPKPLQQRLKRKSRGSDSTRSGSSEDARNLVGEHGFGGLPFAKQLIAEAMLGQMEDLRRSQQRVLGEGDAVCKASYCRSAHADEASASEVGISAGQSPPN